MDNIFMEALKKILKILDGDIKKSESRIDELEQRLDTLSKQLDIIIGTLNGEKPL